MDVRIGIAQSGQIIEIELPADTDRSTVRADIDSALGADGSVLWLTDNKGNDTAIASERIAFVELKEADADQRIGFGA